MSGITIFEFKRNYHKNKIKNYFVGFFFYGVLKDTLASLRLRKPLSKTKVTKKAKLPDNLLSRFYVSKKIEEI